MSGPNIGKGHTNTASESQIPFNRSKKYINIFMEPIRGEMRKKTVIFDTYEENVEDIIE